MRTLILIKQLLKDSDLSSVQFTLDEKQKLTITTDPIDEDLTKKIQDILNKEFDSFFNNI